MNIIQEIAFELLKLGPKAVLVKGVDGCDCLVIENETTPIWIGEKSYWSETKNVHGSGCTLAAAITSFLARGESLIAAVQKAKIYVTNAIRQGAQYELGHGNGPLCHNLNTFTFIQDAWFSIADLYKQIKRLPFLLELADGTLPIEKFEYFINQDRHFLLGASSVCHELASRATNNELKLIFTAIAEKTIIDAAAVFVKYNLTQPPVLPNISPACNAYIEFYKSIVNLDSLAGLVALTPCALIYSKVGTYLKSFQKSPVTSKPSYQTWIDTYSSREKRERVEQLLNTVNKLVSLCSPNEVILLKDIFKKVSQLEYDLWDESYQSPI
jgi:thiaminase/transcriptional activator TenA